MLLSRKSSRAKQGRLILKAFKRFCYRAGIKGFCPVNGLCPQLHRDRPAQEQTVGGTVTIFMRHRCDNREVLELRRQQTFCEDEPPLIASGERFLSEPVKSSAS